MLSLLENQTNSELREGKTFDRWTYFNSGFGIDIDINNFFLKKNNATKKINSYFRNDIWMLKEKLFWSTNIIMF